MKKIILIIIIFLSLILLKLGSTYLLNEMIIKDYENNKYDNNLINTLYFFNINEPYIVYYNHGNLLYRLERYDEAITKYETSLTKHPKEDRVCDIRINLSLSYIKTINETKPEEALSILKKAKNILYEDNCASEDDDNGKSSKAEELEEEIKKLEEQIESGKDDDSDDGKDDDNDDDNDNPDENKNIEEQLKEQQRQNHQSRQEDIDYYNELENNTYYHGKYW